MGKHPHFENLQEQLVFRMFKPTADYLVDDAGRDLGPNGLTPLRLSSAAFKSTIGVSVFPGSLISLQELCTLFPGWGVASLSTSVLETHGVNLVPDPRGEASDHPAHRVYLTSELSKKVPEKLRKAAVIEIRLPDYWVVGAGNSTGYDP